MFNDQSAENKVIVFGTVRKCIDLLASFRNISNRIAYIVNTGEDASDPFFSNYTIMPLSSYRYTSGDRIALMKAYPNSFLCDAGIPAEAVIPLHLWLAGLLRDPIVVCRPWRVRIDICTLCQLRCRDCHMRDPGEATMGYGYIPAETFKNFIDDNPFILSIEISNNGEPLIHPQLHEMITYAYEHHVEISIWNGTNFNDVSDEVLEDLVRYQVRLLNIALDGACQKTYEVYRRNGNFNKVIHNIRKINQLKDKYHSEYPHMTWQFVMMKHNYHEMDMARQMAAELGMTIQFRDSWNADERAAVAALSADRKQAKLLLDADHNTFQTYCSDLLFHPQINWDGRLLGCCQIYKSDWNMNAFDSGFLTVVNSDTYRKTLASILEISPVTADIPCRTCRHKPKTAKEVLAVINS